MLANATNAISIVDLNMVKYNHNVSEKISNTKGYDNTVNAMSLTSFRSFDDIFLVIGEFGSYQKLVYFLCSVTYIMTAMQLLGWVFIGAKNPVRCILPPEKHLTKASMSYSDYSEIVTSSCSYIWDGSNVSNCNHGYLYDTSKTKYSAVMEWDLVCENEGMY